MHIRLRWSGSGGLALFGSIGLILGCKAETEGFGDANADDYGAAGDDADDNSGDNGDADAASSCLLPNFGPEVHIELRGLVDPCSEPTFSAQVISVLGGAYSLRACACDSPQCEGEDLVLDIDLPTADWLPKLEIGGCYQFQLFTEATVAGVCQQNRVDIFPGEGGPLWYSTGSAKHKLEANGLTLTPVANNACANECGEWQLREALVDIETVDTDAAAVLGWGQASLIGKYQVMHWHSYAGFAYFRPAECALMSPSGPRERTAWTARHKH